MTSRSSTATAAKKGGDNIGFNGHKKIKGDKAQPSRPGELHPEPLTEPDVKLSLHPARATHRRLPSSAETNGLIRLPVGPPIAARVTRPLCSVPITGTSSLLRGGPPLSAALVLSASRFRHLRLFPWHRQTGSQVPCISQDEIHAPFTPDTAWTVSRWPSTLLSQSRIETLVSMSS